MSVNRLYKRASKWLVPTMGFADNGGMGMGQLGCCCEEAAGIPCTGCPNDVIPFSLNVTLSGFVSSASCGCSDLNGGYSVPNGDGPLLGMTGCNNYWVDGPTIGCSNPRATGVSCTVHYLDGTDISVTVSPYIIDVFLNHNFATYTERWAADSCLGFSRTLPLIGHNMAPPCDGIGLTCQVSS